MDSIADVQKAIDYIEDNITENLDYRLIAAQAFMSAYHFQRIFSILCSCTLGEYIRNRRLTLAGRELQSKDIKVIDLALKYGYETPESFARAFARFHGITPSMARVSRSPLNSFERISIKSILEGRKDKMKEFSKRGYQVRENGAVYYTKDMDRTAEWFRDILGWYYEIDARDEEGKGSYGCVFSIPHEIEELHIAPFTGIHMFYGEPLKGMAAFMLVQGIDQLYEFVKKNGWEQITEVQLQPWGSKTCDVTTIDGSVLRFFE